jgi:hypothetical protein
MSFIMDLADMAAELAVIEDDQAVQAGNAWQDVETPDFARSFMKVQTFKNRKAGDGSARKFTASGPGAEIVIKMVLAGGWTRREMADTAGVSVSRVAEVVWTMEAAGLDITGILARR